MNISVNKVDILFNVCRWCKVIQTSIFGRHSPYNFSTSLTIQMARKIKDILLPSKLYWAFEIDYLTVLQRLTNPIMASFKICQHSRNIAVIHKVTQIK